MDRIMTCIGVFRTYSRLPSPLLMSIEYSDIYAARSNRFHFVNLNMTLMHRTRTFSPVTGRYLKILLIGYAAWIAIYLTTGWIGALRGPALDVSLALDRQIPYLEGFHVLYLLCYLVPLGILVISDEPAILNRAFLTFISANLAAFLIFVLLPVQGPVRDVPSMHGGQLSFLRGILYAVDSRYNAFPSLHVANATMLAILSWKYSQNALKIIFFTVLAALISISTLFIKQHYLLDVVGGIVLAFISSAVVSRIRISSESW
jgi:membrane-associated phospholipid phosphatase